MPIKNNALAGVGNLTAANNAQAAYRQAPEEPIDSLASVSARVIGLAHSVREHTANLESSFGIALPRTDGAQGAATSATLMSTMQAVEQQLRDSAYALENVLRHVNG